MELNNTARARTYAGLFLVTLATLMEEILLTRIFSVMMWHHFIFLALSVAMFGLTAGGLLVYLAPGGLTEAEVVKSLHVGAWILAAVTVVGAALFLWHHLFYAAACLGLFGLGLGALVAYLAPQFVQPGEVEKHLSAAALGFAVMTVVSFVVYLAIPPVFYITSTSILGLLTILGVVSVPFIFSGIAVCLALTRFPRQVSQLYAADLAGAASGCLLVVYSLRFIDAPSAVILSGALAGLGAFLFASDSWLRRRSILCTVLIAALGGGNALLASRSKSLLELKWMYGDSTEPVIYERWNSFSRVVVSGDPALSSHPFAWGLSPSFQVHTFVRQLSVRIDAGAFTVMTHYDGDFQILDYLKYDVTNLAHYFRPDSKVVVIGAGGGRDVLSALAFGQKSVTAIEMNQSVLNALNHTFGNFSGHLDGDSRVRFVNDEARSYIARMPERADIIEASLVDTWAATLAGAFALSENSIYTAEAWRTFLNHLTPRGLLTFSRWYDPKYPAETYRLVSLATTALAQIGVKDCRGHIMLIKSGFYQPDPDGPGGVSTILVSREAFSPDDLELLKNLTHQMQFKILLSPQEAADPVYARLATDDGLQEYVNTLPGRIGAPTDDSPFFLCDFSVRDIFLTMLGMDKSRIRHTAFEGTLGVVSVAIIFLTVLCFVVPWLLKGPETWVSGSLPMFFFFAALGLGFMLVEVSQLQRLMIFLGHPTYSLSTVLFTLLLSSGLGSYSTGSVKPAEPQHGPLARLLALLAVLAAYGSLTPRVFAAFTAAATPTRIAVAAGVLFPLGFFMGMAFPLGMKAATQRFDSLTPWLWGLNGATSVLASLVAFLIVLGSGESATFWTGFACYAVAFVSYLWTVRGQRPASA